MNHTHTVRASGRKIASLGYPFVFYLAITLPVLVVIALLRAFWDVDIWVCHAPVYMLMVGLYIRRQKKHGAQGHLIPWKMIGLLSAVLVPAVMLSMHLFLRNLLIQAPWTFWVTSLVTFFWGALLEELLFRQYLCQKTLENGLPFWLYMVLTSVGFSLIHGPQTLFVFVERAALGALLGRWYYKHHDLALCIATHWAVNVLVNTTQYCDPLVQDAYGSTIPLAEGFLLGLFLLLGINIVYSLNKRNFVGYS